MTFKPDISQVTIFNEALAILPADPVQAADENSIEARECRRFYKSAVAALLSRYHWNLASTRVVLSAVANTRTTEWAYAFAKPDDMAYPVSVFDASGTGYSGLTAQNYIYMLGKRRMFMQDKDVFYSSVKAATLSYTSFNITEADFTPVFKDILVLHLASRICRAITKDDRVAADLATRAEFETMRAIAHDLNRNQPTYGTSPTETELTRGVGAGNSSGTYPLDPVQVPAYGAISSAYVSVTGY